MTTRAREGAPPVDPAPGPRGEASFPWTCLVVLGLALALVRLPHAPEPGLDPSYWQVLVQAHRAGLRFGPEVAYTYGPLGFLCSPFASDGVPALAMLWRTLGVLALAATLVALSRPLPPLRRGLLWAALVALCSDELALLVCGALLVVGWLLPPRRAPAWQLVVATLWLALFAHVKLTLLLQATCGVGIASAAWLLRGDRRRALGVPAGFVAAFVAAWALAGQSLGDLPTYLLHGWQISSGYDRAMGVNHVPWHVWTAGHVVLGLLASSAGLALRGAEGRRRPPVVLYLAAVCFMAWKHGFVRADGHVAGFFVTTLLLSLALPPHLGRTRLLDACALACLTGLALFDGPQVLRLPGAVSERLSAGATAVASLGRYGDELAAREELVRAAQRRPDLQELVGRGTIDMLGFQQSVLLMNGLEHRPRPVFQGYAAYTPALLRLNQAFFRSPRAPEFVLARLETIDGRFPTQDDALVLAELRLRYDVVHQTLEDALLRRRAAAPAGELERELVFERRVAPGEEVHLPAERDVALWLQVDARPTLRGRLRTLAASEARLELVVTGHDGRSRSHRLIPAMASEGFLVQPLIGQQMELNAFLRGVGLSWVRSFRIEASRKRRTSWGSFTVCVSRLPQLRMEASDFASELVELGVTDVPPAELHSEAPIEVLLEDGRPVLQVHAPGRVVLRRRGARRLTGWFGLRRAIAAPCDGVEFVVRLARGDGGEEVLWRRHLDPLGVSSEAGPQPLDVLLPEGDHDVVLETRPGPAGDTSFDWSYWGQLRLER